MTENKPQLPTVPVVGQEIYVPTALYLSHGEDDMLGGRAIVVKVTEEKHGDKTVHGIKVKEHPNKTYYWENYLAENQVKWGKEFGDQRARPDPDEREEFNSLSTITRDVIRRWLQTGKERGATHVIVISDTFDFTYYPLYVMPGEDPLKIANKEAGAYASVKEVYSLNMDIESQLNEQRAYHID